MTGQGRSAIAPNPASATPGVRTRPYKLPLLPSWTLRILSGISEGICNTMVQSGGEFLYI